MSLASSPEPSRRTQRERVDESTRRLLQAAAELIAERGYHQTTAVDIATRAGYSREMVRVRFGSKAALIDELLADEHRDWMLVPDDPEADGLARLRAGVDRLSKLAELMPVHLRAVFALNLEAATGIRELQPALTAWLEQIEERVRVTIELGIADGSIRSDVDAVERARQFVAVASGVAYLFVLNPEPTDPGHLLRLTVDDLAAPRRARKERR